MSQEFKKRILSSVILFPLVFFFIFKGSFIFNFFLIIVFLITSKEWFKMQSNKLIFITGMIFLLFSFYSAYLLRGDSFSSFLIFLLVIITCIATDIGGYVFGKIFKGPKLTKISPNKTYSGVLGSYLFTLILVFLYLKILDLYFINAFLPETSRLLIVIFIISSVSQLGDLIISFFKRKSDIKDTSNLIPGHGGILDRIDGIIFAVPISLFLLKLIQ